MINQQTEKSTTGLLQPDSFNSRYKRVIVIRGYAPHNERNEAEKGQFCPGYFRRHWINVTKMTSSSSWDTSSPRLGVITVDSIG